MNEYESITEEYDNDYEEIDQEMKGNNDDFPLAETVTVTKVN